ncbi:MAG TPA: hypothetical protein PKL39_06165 [Bacillota bacterium]|nr:hypothetical protein [Bacillota bacterium]
MFIPKNYQTVVRELGDEIASNIGVSFTCCKWSGDHFAFKGIFSYRGETREVILATRKELEDNKINVSRKRVEKELVFWKRELDSTEELE